MTRPRGWLVNDQLGALGERTFWHELRDHCGLEDHSGVSFGRLVDKVEHEYETATQRPRLIVRNASYFRPLVLPCRTVSIAQDIMEPGKLRDMQQAVLKQSDVVVFNTTYTARQIGCLTDVRHEIIPIGTDFDLFRPSDGPGESAAIRDRLGIAEDSVLFVGSGDPVKGFGLLRDIIDRTYLPFCVVTKDGATIDHPRVRNFGPVSQPQLRDIMVACSVLVCTSVRETQHLAGIEAGACGLPIVAPLVGVYSDLYRDRTGFGWVVKSRRPDDYVGLLEGSLDYRDTFRTREFFLSRGLDRPTCQARWNQLLDSLEAA